MPTSDEGLARLATALRASTSFPLKNSFSLPPEEFEFWRQQTGIEETEDLEQHVLKIQHEACAVLPYGCIRNFSFLHLRITCVPGYDKLIELGSEREGAILLDVGCCLGTDIRKVAADGWPTDSIITTDVESEFWELGHRLFCSTAETFPAVFLPGDIFDPAHLSPAHEVDGVNDPAVSSMSHDPEWPTLPLTSLTSLNPLRGHVAAIHAGALFHLFSEERQTALARALASLLSPKSGSMIVGSHAGAPHKGIRVITRAPDHIPRTTSPALSQFCHSPESWAELWDGQVFERGSVKVEAVLVKPDIALKDFPDYYTLYWSVTRL